MLSRKFKLLNIELDIQQDLSLSHGGSVWDGALVLLHYFQKNFKKIENIVKGNNILELGAGTGILGIAINEFQPNKVIMTDLEMNLPLLIKNKDQNIQFFGQNLKNENLLVEKLEWGDENSTNVELFLEKHGPIDLIMGSDLTYDDTNNIRLFQTLKQIFTKYPKLLMILAFTMFKQTDDAFLKDYADLFNFEFVKYSQMHKDYRSEDINIVYITWKTQYEIQDSKKIQ